MVKSDVVIPARRILGEAEAENRRLGHENLGFLSPSHGFMPVERPLLALPESHRVWDEVVANLPELFRTLQLRPALQQMPLLSTADLPDRFLLRAVAILGIFAHANYYVQPEPPEGLPESVARPWAEISQRLKRPKPHLSFIDLNIYNYKLINPDLPDPMRMENLELLIPIVGNEDERRFQTTPIEMVAQATPAIELIIRTQKAVVEEDLATVKQSLLALTDLLQYLSYVSFLKVNPNSHSRTYVNPVVWGKTVAPLATPYQDPAEGIPGPSGTAIPTFQMLDIFFGRQGYKTTVGHETARTRPWFPHHWQAFLDALEKIDVVDFVRRSSDRMVQGIFKEALDAYAGDAGLLGRHRLKTYGFLDLSFKAGRSKTLGGFGGGFSDRLWDRMDGELNKARLERYQKRLPTFHCVRFQEARPVTGSAALPVREVILDVAGSGIRYKPGDRCAILPVNSGELVAKTLKGLRARGDEPIQLNSIWRQAVKGRPGYERAKVLSLRTLLRFGKIRPVDREVAKALYGLSYNQTLLKIIEARAEDQWELWDLLNLLAETGFNTKQLWKAVPGEPESICWLVPPERYRMYSISAVMPDPNAESAETIHLTIGRLAYKTPESEVSNADVRYGTSSSFLARLDASPEDGEPLVSVKIIHPPRFNLPQEMDRPVILFAGGSGLAPFRGFLQERMRQSLAGENWLFFGIRRREELYYEAELAQMVAENRLHLHVACSRDDIAIYSEGGKIRKEAGERHRIDREILAPENARRLWDLLRPKSEGGEGGYLYVCGRTGFAATVMTAVKELFVQFAPGTESEKERIGREMLYRMVGENRYLQEIFTTYPGPQFEQKRVIDASEVVLRNNDEDGYWIIINGRVYDVTEFAQLHPGGLKIIQSYAGMDASNAYRMVLHDANPEVDAMIGMYEIGVVRRLDFGAAWSMAIGGDGLEFVMLKDIYRAWLTFLYDVVEMENALLNDYGIRQEPVTYNEGDGRLEQSPYKTRLLLQTHQRFVGEYLPMITGESLCRVWALVGGMHSEYLDFRWMERRLAAVQGGGMVRQAAELEEEIARRLLIHEDTTSLVWSIAACQVLETADRQFLQLVKSTLRTGLRAFEEHEEAVIHAGSKVLLTAVQRFPDILASYYREIVDGIHRLEL